MRRERFHIFHIVEGVSLIETRRILELVLSMLVASILVDPSDTIFHLKLPLFTLVIAIWGFRALQRSSTFGSLRLWAIVVLFAFLLPSLASFIGFFDSTAFIGESHPFQILKSCSMLLLIPVLRSESIDMNRYIVKWSILVAVFTIGLAVLSVQNPLIFSNIKAFLLDKNEAFVGPRDLLGLGIGSFYYKTVALLVFPIVYFLRQLLDCPNKWASGTILSVFLASVLCSGSRATVLVCAGVVGIVIAGKVKKRFGTRTALFLLLSTAILSCSYFMSFFNVNESSNAAKIGHFWSYITEFGDHPRYLLWGQGADTEFYTTGFEAKTYVTELTYLELIRTFGLPISILVAIALLYPAYELVRRKERNSFWVVAYLAYLFEAGTNPLLISATGTLVICSIWGIALTPSLNTGGRTWLQR